MTIFSKWLTMEEQERDCNLTKADKSSSCTILTIFNGADCYLLRSVRSKALRLNLARFESKNLLSFYCCYVWYYCVVGFDWIVPNNYNKKFYIKTR